MGKEKKTLEELYWEGKADAISDHEAASYHHLGRQAQMHYSAGYYNGLAERYMTERYVNSTSVPL